MNNKTEENLKSAIIETDDDKICRIMESLDLSDNKVVDSVLNVIESIVSEFILPHADLLSHSEDGFSYFDLDKLACYEYPGLIGGILEAEFPKLSVAPESDVLGEKLESSGFTIDTIEARKEFFCGWIAKRAVFTLETVVAHLKNEQTFLDKALRKRLRELINRDITGTLKLRLSEILENHNKNNGK